MSASNRAAAGVYEDRTGPTIVEWLRARGYETPEPLVVPDGQPVGAALRAAVDDQVSVIITTGGTGINPTDRTPEVTAELLDRPIPGLAEAIRTAGLPGVPTAVLSRGLAGVGGRSLIVNLPGSRGGVQDGLDVLAGVVDHAVDQIAGGDHDRQAGGDHDRQVGGDHELPTGENNVADVHLAEVTDEPVQTETLARLVQHRSAGAVATFGGVVRDHDDGRGVRELEYVSHPTASDVITEVAADLAKQRTGVRGIAVAHRVGLLEIGDTALGCAVAADHRAEAFETCSQLVDEVKRRLPIWKRQVFDDGVEEWVNCP